jgi:type I restriction enzyme S subunit
MKKYQKYKDSGVEWIGEIPEEWEKSKIKYEGKIFGRIGYRGYTVDDIVDKGNGVISLSPSNIDNQYLKLDNNTYISWKKYNESPEIQVFPFDIILVKTSSVGKICLIPNGVPELTLNPQLVVIKKIRPIPNFLYYCLISKEFQFNFSLETTGGVTPTISQEKVNNFYVILPKLPEQQQIVDFLDQKTSIIDNLIQKKQRKIELLKEERTSIINQTVTKGLNPNVKMKDSGVEWIGEIPEHWERKKIKNICKIFGRIGYRGYTTDDIVNEGEGVITISPGNIKKDIFNLDTVTYLSFEKYYESPEIMIFPEDIILVKTGSTIGKTSIIPKDTPLMTLNPQLIVLKEIKSNHRFFYYQTICDFIKRSFEVEQTGGTTPTISQEKVYMFPVLEPSLPEQQQIVEFLDQKTTEIDTTITLENKKIDLLKEYRQSLISEVVTGKIDVRKN